MGQAALASVEVDNKLKQSISSHMKSTVDNNSTSYCKNVQSAKNVNGCDIEFGPQVCKALAITHLNADATLQADLTQDIFNDVSAAAAASNEGLGLLQYSDSSTFVKNVIDMAVTSTQSLTTKCTRNATAINQQAIDGCTDTVLKFAKQDADATIIGDCTVKHVADTKVKQKLTNIVDASATSHNKGISMFEGIVMIMIALICTGTLTKIMTSGKNQQQHTPGERLKIKIVYFLGAIWLFLFVVVWPGALSIWQFHTWPWGAKESDGDDAVCDDGIANEKVIMSPILWYDPGCYSLEWGTDSPEPCTEDNKWKRYRRCGLLNTSTPCPSKALEKDVTRLKKMQKACSEIHVPNLRSCTVRDLTYQDLMGYEYGGCTRCTNDESIYGLFVNNGKSCSPGDIDLKYYKIPDGEKCPNDPYCVETEAELLRLSPNDCTNDAYQLAKKTFSKFIRACEVINTEAYLTPKPGYVPLFNDVCPASPYDYLACDKHSDKCSYDAGSNATAAQKAACANDFSDCYEEVVTRDGKVVRQVKDPKYRADLKGVENLDRICKEKVANDYTRYMIPILVGGAEVLIIIAMLYLALSASEWNLGAQLMQNMQQRENQLAFNFTITLLGVFLLLVGTYPFGYFARVDADKPYSIYDTDIKDEVDYDEKGYKTKAYAFTIAGSILLLYGTAKLAFLWFTKPAVAMPLPTPKPVPVPVTVTPLPPGYPPPPQQ